MNSATSGGNITNDAGSFITARGIVWDTQLEPTITINSGITNNGAGLGSYTSNITGLIPGTAYYVRAYATNSNGTEYGNTIQFKAQQELTITGDFTASNKVYDRNTKASILANNLSLVGVISGQEDVAISELILAFDNAIVGNDKTVSIKRALLTGTDAYKYSISLINSPTTTANIIASGADELNFDNLRVYPNPFTDNICIASQWDISKITLTNLVGQKLIEQNIWGDESFNTSALPRGVYIITIEFTNAGNKTVKIIKQ